MRRRSLSFRWHLALLGILVVVPIIVAAAAISALYVASERAGLERQTIATARDIASAVDRQLEGSIAALRTLALSQPLANGDFEAFHGQAAQIRGIIEAGVIGLRTADGEQVVNTALPFGTPLPRAVDPILRRADRLALEQQRPVVSDVYTGAATGQLFVAVVNPIVVKGAPYLLSLAIPPENIRRTMADSRTVPEDWLLVVTDSNHRVVARSRDHDRFVGATASPEFSSQLQGAEGTFTSTTLDGVRVLDAYTRSAVSGFTITAAVPATWAAAPLLRAIAVTALIAGLGVLCSVLLALAYGRYLTPPILALRNAALQLARRRSLQPIKVGIRELDAVSDAIGAASTDLERQDRAEQILINELNHRVKNSLVVVQSIAHQTLARASSMAGFGHAFSGRLVAFAKAHDALSETGWVSAELRDLVLRVCTPVAGDGRLQLEGPPVHLPARVVLTLGLVLHELATNAVKYGALTAAAGRVHIRWNVQKAVSEEPGILHLTWRESGGPVISPPGRRGFGSRIVLASIAEDLRGRASLDFPPEGACFRAEIPLGGTEQAVGRAPEPSGGLAAIARERGGKVQQGLIAAGPADE